MFRPVGSPPRAWGRLERLRQDREPDRFTPTCVGTASCSTRAAPRCSVHPHVRGDGARTLDWRDITAGSPPRAWGRRAAGRLRHRVPRFTPTRVGTAARSAGRQAAPTVHPHVRGDGGGVGVRHGLLAGSPPRAWGRRRANGSSPVRRRFTPTCVGTAGTWASTAASPPVHPHVRGDGSSRPWLTQDCDGSPPRAWGRRLPTPVFRAYHRFTPTCVGTACPCPCPWWSCSVHPHVRGDG